MKESASLEETAKKLEIELQGPDIRQINRQDLAQEKLTEWYSNQRVNLGLAYITGKDKKITRKTIDAISEKVDSKYAEFTAYISTRFGK